jgi:hypothetical protein
LTRLIFNPTMKGRMKKSELGQALIIILLIMAVGLTVGLSIISRSITDIKISRQEEESARAFSVAEAGIEEALKRNLIPGETLTADVGGIDYNVSAEVQGEKTLFDFAGNKFDEGDIQTVWLVEHNAEGEPDPTAGVYTGNIIEVCWGDDMSDLTAVEVSLIYDDGGFKVGRGAYDANNGRVPPNGFDSDVDTTGGNCGDLAFSKQINLTTDLGFSGTPYALRLKLLYNSEPEPLAVSSIEPVAFPSQGKCYEASASMTASGITSHIRYCQSHKAPPGIFDYVLFSESGLTHN